MSLSSFAAPIQGSFGPSGPIDRSRQCERLGPPVVRLAGRRAPDGVGHHDLPWNFVSGQPSPARGAQCLAVDSAPRTRLHYGYDPLTVALIRHPHDDDVFDVVAVLHGGFHLVGEDLLPTGVDAERAPTEDHDRTAGVDRGHVARKCPTLASGLHERGRRLLDIAEIPDGNVATARQAAQSA